MDGVVKEVNVVVLGKWLELLSANGFIFVINLLLFADDSALLADSEEKLLLLLWVLSSSVRESPPPIRKIKQLSGKCHRSSGLLMLCCALM